MNTKNSTLVHNTKVYTLLHFSIAVERKKQSMKAELIALVRQNEICHNEKEREGGKRP